MTEGVAASDRRAELTEALARVELRIAEACRQSGRPRQDVSWVAVSKSWPASDIARVRELGVRDLGESKDQEAAAKADQLAGLDLSWHFVGQLQTNKARSVASYASVVQSVDRARLARALSDGAERSGRTVDVLVQVSLDGELARGGCLVADLAGLADLVASLPSLRLAGLMAVAPRLSDPRPAFDDLVRQSERLRSDHPEAAVVSAGMSGDLEQAVAAGATLLRVGTALFGHRSPLLR